MRIDSLPSYWRLTAQSAKPKPRRLVWLEGIRIIAAVMILLYHAQLYFRNYTFTPQPTGLFTNLTQWLTANSGMPIILQWVTAPFWFGFQFLDVFILISGFSLVLSLKGEPLDTIPFLKQRLLRLLMPLWTVAWFAYPVLWLLGTATHTYKPDSWHSFAGLTFPLTSDYRGSALLSTNGTWWFIPLIVSLTLLFPWLWQLSQRWGMRNLLCLSLLVTITYRILAIYLLGGHPTYVLVDTPAGEAPFQLFLAKLSTFVLGMAIARAYLQGRGPFFWRQRRAGMIGSFLYAIGFICQFYQVGWIFVDLILPPGLLLVCMVITRRISQFEALQPGLLKLGTCSYSFFLIHDFVVNRLVNLVVHDDVTRYLLLLPVMVGLTLILALSADTIRPLLQKGLINFWHQIDRMLTRSPATSNQPINQHGR